MGMTLRVEIFPSDLDATVDFYTRVLGFALVTDTRRENGYVALQRDGVCIGALAWPSLPPLPPYGESRRPPVGTELVLEVDDLAQELDRIQRAGWPLEEELTTRPWGLRDFRLLDPSGYYLRITNRPGENQSEGWA